MLQTHALLAHEAYVIESQDFWNFLSHHSAVNFFQALKDPGNLHTFFWIAFWVAVVYLLNFLLRLTFWEQRLDRFLEKFAKFGPLIVRWAIGISFIFSAWSNAFLGPELTLDALPWSGLIRAGLFVAGLFFIFGFMTEISALFGLVVMIVGFYKFGFYLLTYANYLGELLVLLFFGMRIFSLDRKILGPLTHWMSLEKYETSIVRLFYGFGLLYAGVTIKFLHQDLTVKVVEDWHLTKFTWLFPHDPMLVALGAGLAEITIGLFIMFGFEMRLTVLVSLFYITLSLIYFRELVWPHLMLYGISLNLLLQPEVFTIDHLIFDKHRRVLSWFYRPFRPHVSFGKSQG